MPAAGLSACTFFPRSRFWFCRAGALPRNRDASAVKQNQGRAVQKGTASIPAGVLRCSGETNTGAQTFY